MFDYTRDILSKTWSDIKKIDFICHALLYAIGVAVPIYSIIFNKGSLILNICLLIFGAVSLTLYLVYYDTDDKGEKKKLKAKRKKTKRAKKFIGRLSDLYKVVMLIYSICFATIDPSPITVLLSAFTVIIFIIKVILDIIVALVKKRITLIKNSFSEDWDIIQSSLNPVNLIKRMRGEEPERKSNLSEQDRIYLEDYIDEQKTAKK